MGVQVGTIFMIDDFPRQPPGGGPMSERREPPWRLPTAAEAETVMPPEIDTTKPHTARIYDYMLGGKDNFEADRQVAAKIIQAIPDMQNSLRLNRQFLRR